MPLLSEVRSKLTGARLPFPEIELTTDECMHYDRIAGQLLQRTLVQQAQFGGSVDKREWQFVRQRGQMSMHKSIRGTDNPKVVLMLGSGFIDGSVEEVMEGLHCDTTDELRITKTLLKYKFVDGAIMSVLETRTPDDPFRFAGIKWFVAKTPGGAMSSNRDLLTYERMGYIEDLNGEQVAFHVLQSIERPEWPANTLKHIKRSFTTTCFVYRRVRSNLTEVFGLGEFYGAGGLARKMADYVIAGKWLGVATAPECAQAKKLSRLMGEAAASNRPPSTSTSCDICGISSKIMKRYRHCAGCLQTVCNNCSARRMIFKIDLHTREADSARFCVGCFSKSCGHPGRVELGAIPSTDGALRRDSIFDENFRYMASLHAGSTRRQAFNARNAFNDARSLWGAPNDGTDDTLSVDSWSPREDEPPPHMHPQYQPRHAAKIPTSPSSKLTSIHNPAREYSQQHRHHHQPHQHVYHQHHRTPSVFSEVSIVSTASRSTSTVSSNASPPMGAAPLVRRPRPTLLLL